VSVGERTDSLPQACPGCGAEHKGDRAQGGAKWLAWAAHARAADLGLPAACVRPGPPRLRLTLYTGGGVQQANRSERWEGGLRDLASRLRAHAARVVPKGQGDYYLDGLSRTAFRRDEDMVAWTAESLDCDGVPGGDWTALARALEEAGLGALLMRSSSHTPDSPHWKAVLPFAEPQQFDAADKAEWTARRAWIVGCFSALADLSGAGKDYGPAGAAGPACGLDLRGKAGPGQPVYMPARRAEDQAAPEVRVIPGGALDVEAFLAATGYHEARRAWLAEQERKPKRPPRCAPGPAGNPDASLARLRPEVREAARRWARQHCLRFARCGDRNAACLAVGGYLGRRGIAGGLAAGVVEAIAEAAGLPDPSSRGRTAAYSARNAAAGERALGLPKVRELLGEEAAQGLADLASALTGPGPGPRRPQRTSRERVVLPLAEPAGPDDHERFQREALGFDALEAGQGIAPDGEAVVYVDAAPTGVGKTTRAIRLLPELLGAHDALRAMVLVDDHEHADRWEAELGEPLRRAGVSLGRLPKLTDETCMQADAYMAVARAGHNPTQVLCRDCPYNPRSEQVADGRAVPCAHREGVGEATRSEVRLLIAQKAGHANRLGFYTEGYGRGFGLFVVDEDLRTPGVVELRATEAELRLYTETLLPSVRRTITSGARSADDEETAARFAEELAAVDAAARITRRLLVGARSRDRVVQVGGGRDDVEQLLARGSDLQRLVTRRSVDRREAGHPLAKNLVPLILTAAERIAERGEFASLSLEGSGVAVNVPQHLPPGRRLVNLDATADRAEVEAITGASVPPARVFAPSSGRSEPIHVLLDGQLSRAALGVPLLADAGPDDPVPEALDKVALRVARLLRRLGRRRRSLRVGVVTYKPLVDDDAGAPFLRAVEQHVSRRLGVTWRTLWPGAARGRNDFEGWADVVLVVGTPNTPPDAVRLHALMLGAGAEELDQEPEHVEADGRRVFTYPGEVMRRAHMALVGAELAQLAGRGARGDYTPELGTWVLSSFPFEAKDPLRLTDSRTELLDLEPEQVWDAAERGPGASRRDVARRLKVGDRVARRVQDHLGRHNPVSGQELGADRPLMHPHVKTRRGGITNPLREQDITGTSWGTSHIDIYRADAPAGPTPGPTLGPAPGPVPLAALAGLARLAEELGAGTLAARLGVARRTVRRWRAGDRQPGPEHVKQIVDLAAELPDPGPTPDLVPTAIHPFAPPTPLDVAAREDAAERAAIQAEADGPPPPGRRRYAVAHIRWPRGEPPTLIGAELLAGPSG